MATQPTMKSLMELGFKVEPIHGKDSKGNEWVYRVRGPEPIFFIKRTKRGRLLAYRTKDALIDTTINGLYRFQERKVNDRPDLVGSPATVTSIDSRTTRGKRVEDKKAA